MSSDTLNSLFKSLKNEDGFSELNKKFEYLEKKKEQQEVELEAHEVDKINRQQAYSSTKRSMRNWQGFVMDQRRKESVSFPLNFQTRNTPNLAGFSTSKSIPSLKTKLELDLEQALPHEEKRGKKSKLIKKMQHGDPLPKIQITPEEFKEKQRHLAKLRALLSYQAVKGKRQNKIKSKNYRKMKRRAEEDKLKKQLEGSEAVKGGTFTGNLSLKELKKIGAGGDLKVAIERAKLDRAKERATLKHKNTSRWIQRQLRLMKKGGGGNKMIGGGREAVLEQLRKGEELRRKIGLEEEEDEEDEDDFDDDDDDDDDISGEHPEGIEKGDEEMQKMLKLGKAFTAPSQLVRDDYDELNGNGSKKILKKNGEEGERGDYEDDERMQRKREAFLSGAAEVLRQKQGLFAMTFMQRAIKEQIEEEGATDEVQKKVKEMEEEEQEEMESQLLKQKMRKMRNVRDSYGDQEMSEDDGADEEEERWVADLPNSSQSARKVKAPIDISQTDIQRKHGGSDIDDLAKEKETAEEQSRIATNPWLQKTTAPLQDEKRKKSSIPASSSIASTLSALSLSSNALSLHTLKQSEDEKKEDEEDESEDGGIIDSEVNEEADDLESDDDDGMLSASRLRTRDDRAAENGHVPAVKNEIFRDEKAQRRTDERVFGASKRMKLEVGSGEVGEANGESDQISKKDKKKTKKGRKENEDEDSEIEKQLKEERQIMGSSGTHVSGGEAAEFEEMKKREEEERHPKEKQIILPGYGFWIGEGCVAPKHIPKAAIVKSSDGRGTISRTRDASPNIPPRSAPPSAPPTAAITPNTSLPRVIISERKDKHFINSLTVPKLPFGYTTKEAFDYAMSKPEGTEWTKASTHKKFIQPKVETHSGVIIDPLTWNKKVENAGPKRKEMKMRKKEHNKQIQELKRSKHH
ncbi:putative U3 small nucleolar RNA-associated protein 14 [Monocercomonoides exilis]|uniref:putative U3 small nucleolar RNA-associated protein 14 n=1 Tax=Monocercomonoides exilis TaxID=2049356 RepID=UPI00355AC0E7|nr:putative U3 small nucleolar RNA-associated protein 14 [Monocercomonoides exilis]|eukprot:MONOS_14773.1-p1 / transcript=MONOS_14773.1 / gene=MONOS_14773 / organism=Monocercomonoides_exilis_PA203 / gene_product=unspecified product / transcript_product=unspecified product / location=Mono_scaffold01070:1294-4407(-) / protein_length=915 / sequence_SO=supercontig / SO=protein_coding / is_pseudo=false